MEKQKIRENIWDRLEESGKARFPYPPHNRIPNFTGAEKAADRLTNTKEWKKADKIKSNPDSPQKPVRKKALKHGKELFMAVPRLKDEKCFFHLDPSNIDNYHKASSIKGASKFGIKVHPSEINSIDLIVTGSVAVNNYGIRVGKGGGFSDLEYAILREFETIDNSVTVATTVHEMQVIDKDISSNRYDVPIDLIVTKNDIIETNVQVERPSKIFWEELSDQKIDQIPLIQSIREKNSEK